MPNIGEGGGATGRDAVMGDKVQEPGECAVQVSLGPKFTGERAEFRANPVEINELLLLAGMEKA